MAFEDKKRWLQEEESRLIKYQHQHRGLSFLKLLLPPTTDRKVNLVGVDNHIYRGSVPSVPEDQLPPEVDEKSIDEEALYKEIRDMNFPPVPEQEPLGPSRRIGGSYTLAKTLAFAPVQIEHGELEETSILGKDGGFYRGTARRATRVELQKQLRGTKRVLTKMRQASSSGGYVEPTLVTLQVDSRFPSHQRHQKSIIKMPITNIENITGLIKSQSEKAVKVKESIDEKGNEDIVDTAESKVEESTTEDEVNDIKDLEESQQTAEVAESAEEGKQSDIENVEEPQPDEKDQTESSTDSKETEETEQSEESDTEEADEESDITTEEADTESDITTEEADKESDTSTEADKGSEE